MVKLKPSKLPIIVITGFLGSGKTTLLNRLLRQWPDSAVLINEFGATAVDPHLLEQSDIPLTVLAGGCLCCQVRGALAPTLKNLWMAWNRPEGLAFDRLLIEASGVASPEPILDTLLRERWLAPRLHLQGIIATLAVPVAEQQFAAFPEALAQAAWADAFVLTQADLAEADQLASLHRCLDRIAPATPRWLARNGEVDASGLLAGNRAGRYVNAASPPALPEPDFHRLEIIVDFPIDWPTLRAALESLLSRHRQRLVRVKGIVPVTDRPSPVIVQAAAGRLFPPRELPTRPAGDVHGRFVFITAGVIEHLAEEWGSLLSRLSQTLGTLS